MKKKGIQFKILSNCVNKWCSKYVHLQGTCEAIVSAFATGLVNQFKNNKLHKVLINFSLLMGIDNSNIGLTE